MGLFVGLGVVFECKGKDKWDEREERGDDKGGIHAVNERI